MKYLRLVCLGILLLGFGAQVYAEPAPPSQAQHESEASEHTDVEDASGQHEGGSDESTDPEDPGDSVGMPCPSGVCDNNGGGARNPVAADP